MKTFTCQGQGVNFVDISENPRIVVDKENLGTVVGIQSHMKLGQILRNLREERGLTLREVAEVLGISHTAVSNKEMGAVRIRPRELETWAAIFGKTPPQLQEMSGTSPYSPIPLLSQGKAVQLFATPWEAVMRKVENFVAGTFDVAPNAFALLAEDEGMEPDVPRSAVLICEPVVAGKNNAIKDGQVVVIWTGTQGAETCKLGKWFFIQPSNQVEVRRSNPAFSAISLPWSQAKAARVAVVREVRIRT
jgi:transcriptional regulator with XRE-family HTH domain